jgi:hypothetical protein
VAVTIVVKAQDTAEMPGGPLKFQASGRLLRLLAFLLVPVGLIQVGDGYHVRRKSRHCILLKGT